MPAEVTGTILTKQDLERNEAFVVAEGSLRREVVVAKVRIAVIVLAVLNSAVVSAARGGNPDLVRGCVAALYLVFAIGILRGISRAITEQRDAAWLRATRVWPIFVTLADVGFYMALFLAPVDHVESLPALFRERTAFTFALLIVFAVSRPSAGYVAFSTLASLFGYWGTVYTPYRLYGVGPRPLSQGGTDLDVYVSSVFLAVGFCALGFLVARTQALMREDFKGLRSIDNLRKFLPGPVAERLAREGSLALRPVQRTVTVMFTDIRDFTSHCEHLEPKQVLEFLDEYLAHMSQIVKGHDGIVNKFLGDGMLAFWGVPELNDRHAVDAVGAALDIRKKMNELNENRARNGLPIIRVGVGVHSGVVAAGMLGGADQHEYTIIGDAVNVASRIEGLNKAHGTDILLSESTVQMLEGRFLAEKVGDERVKGRERPVTVYRLVDRAPAPASAA